MVLQTNMSDILARIEDQNRLVKQEAPLSAAPAAMVHQLKSINLPQQFKDMKLPDLPQAIKVSVISTFIRPQSSQLSTFFLQDLKFWPTTSYDNTDQPSPSTVFNKFSTKLAYEPIASPTDSAPSIDRCMPLDTSYQHSVAPNRASDDSFHSEFITNEHTSLGTLKPCTNGWLSSLQTFSTDLGNSIGNTLAGNGSGATAFTSSEHQPLAGIDSEFGEDGAPNTKYTYWTTWWIYSNGLRNHNFSLIFLK